MSGDTYTSAQAAKVIGVSTRRVRQMRAAGELESTRQSDGSYLLDQASVHAARTRKLGGGNRRGTAGGSSESVIDLTDGVLLKRLVAEAIAEELPRALESATSADRLAREQAQAALFEAQARITELEAQLAAPKRRRWRRSS